MVKFTRFWVRNNSYYTNEIMKSCQNKNNKKRAARKNYITVHALREVSEVNFYKNFFIKSTRPVL